MTVALYAAGMALMFRFAWLPGPSASIGDTADGMILTATLEHWFRVFTGRAADWLSPGWFWPATGTLGLTDTYFLIALPYGVVRALGFGPFGSYTASVAVLATTGFWGLVGLTRRCGVPAAIAGAMAFVFAFGALPTFKLHHGQTYTVMLAPILGLLLHSAWRSRKGAATAAWAGAAGVMYGLMTLTAPQTAWFLGFSAGLAGIALLLLTVPFGVLPVSRKREELLQKTVTIAAGGALGLAVGFVPVLLVYSSALAGRRRFWADVLSFSPRFTDLLNVQPGNLLWEGPLRLAGITDIPGRSVSEMALGFTPVLALSALVALLLLGRARRLAGPHPWDLPARAFLAAAFMGWLITVNYGAVAPWRLVFDYVPGASGIRTPFRIQLASFFFLCFGLAHAAARAMAVAAARSSPGLAAAIGAVLALCVVEQAGPTTTVRNTRELARWLVASHRPSFPCEAFYVLPLSKPSYLQWFEQESDAMMLSQWIGMPTLNGNSSWMPRGYEMVHIDWPNYAANKLAWIDAHDLRDRVCGVEPRAGRWEPGVGPLLRAAGR
ncbi:MAG: hypothetical protein JO157_07920 [Acetobacteraceae bacterium]|nr:hypothetical protein [Acetobacteraceae bacterium]